MLVQFTCVSVRPVFFARVLFSSGVGYLHIYVGCLVYWIPDILEYVWHFILNLPQNRFFLPVMFVHILQGVP